MRGAILGRVGCGLVLAAIALGTPYVFLGDVRLAGERPPFGWLALLGLLAVAGGMTGVASLPTQPRHGTIAVFGGLVAAAVITGAFALEYGSAMAGLGAAG